MLIYYMSFANEMKYQVAYLDMPTIYDISWWLVPGTINLED